MNAETYLDELKQNIQELEFKVEQVKQHLVGEKGGSSDDVMNGQWAEIKSELEGTYHSVRREVENLSDKFGL